MIASRHVLAALAIALLGATACAGGRAPLDPALWERHTDTEWRVPKPMAAGTRGVIVGTTGGPAIGAGLALLERGGSAADAALATALGQVALAAGSWVSYAGLLTMLYYDAESGAVHHLNANFNTVLGEDDPLTIPFQPTPSGRTALVPGFMAGVEAAHRRFGKLPFAEIFAPAIHYAEAGFVLDSIRARMIAAKREVLSRLPASKAFITREDGAIYAAGDRFRQPATAETLRHVAAQGASYMYTGPWAERFVAAVRAEGGRMTMADLERYAVEWSPPLRLPYRGHELYSSSESHYLLGVFNLLEASGLTERGHYAESPEVFAGFHRVMRATGSLTRQIFGPAPTPDADWLDPARGTAIWEQVRAGTFPLPPSGGGPIPAGYAGHSDAVVAVDRWGNVAALTHSINTGLWGFTGLIVDGITIPDAASYQQGNIAAEGGGVKHWAGILPVIVLRDGKPVAAMSSIGAGLQQETVKVLVNQLAYGHDAKAANDAPSFLQPRFASASGFGIGKAELVFGGDYGAALLDGVRALGLAVEEIAFPEAAGLVGMVVNVAIDPATGRYTGAAARFSPGRALGY